DSVRKAAVLDENNEIRAGAAVAFIEENNTTVVKIAWLSSKESTKAYSSVASGRQRLAIRHSNARTPRNARNAPKKATTIAIIIKRSLSVFYAEAHINHIAKTVGSSTLTPSEDDSRPTLDNPNGTSQINEDSPFHMERRQINKDVEAEQVPIESLDLTAAVIRLPERLIFMASVYMEGGDAQALRDTCNHLRKAITKSTEIRHKNM
ncbi:hypothetical protein TSTA_101820, partial [Talaromyces stipitatus ATCC 10500]